MKEKLKSIDRICIERNIQHEFVEDEYVRIFPSSFNGATLQKADLYEYLFKMGLDTRHTATKNGTIYTDIYAPTH